DFAPQEGFKLALHSCKGQKGHPCHGLEAHQQIYITLGTVILAEHGPKERQLTYLVAAAEAREFFKGNVQSHCVLHRHSCLKTSERIHLRGHRRTQSKVTRFE